MNDLSIFTIGAAEEGIQTVGDVFARTCGPKDPRHDADPILASNSTGAAHYEDTASSNYLALGKSSPGGEETEFPFHVFAKEQFGSLLYANFSRIEQLPLEWMHNKIQQTESISGTSISKEVV